MASRRTISYIGLWALILPWLGLTWEAKSLLFSFTGAILLIIGNRYYFVKRQKEIEKKDEASPLAMAESQATENSQPALASTGPMPVGNAYGYMQPIVKSEEITESAIIAKPRAPRTRKRVEMVTPVRTRTTTVKPEVPIEPDYGQTQL